jgi:hypothetical protein
MAGAQVQLKRGGEWAPSKHSAKTFHRHFESMLVPSMRSGCMVANPDLTENGAKN